LQGGGAKTPECAKQAVWKQRSTQKLDPSEQGSDGLEGRPAQRHVVAGVSEITSPKEVVSAIRLGNKRRTYPQKPTKLVPAHTQCCRSMWSTRTAVRKCAKMSLIDLDGSERVRTLTTLRLIESANINRSLLLLAICINALSEGVRRAKMHIQYRDSKLTRRGL